VAVGVVGGCNRILYVQVVVVEFQLLLEGIYDCSWVKMKVEEEEVTVQNLMVLVAL
jgi:hypothetical protein